MTHVSEYWAINTKNKIKMKVVKIKMLKWIQLGINILEEVSV